MWLVGVVCAEREENVKTDIFTAYRALLTVTQSQSAAQSSGEDGMEVSDRYGTSSLPIYSLYPLPPSLPPVPPSLPPSPQPPLHAGLSGGLHSEGLTQTTARQECQDSTRLLQSAHLPHHRTSRGTGEPCGGYCARNTVLSEVSLIWYRE